MGKYSSMSGGGTMLVYLPDVEYSLPHKQGPLPPIEWWLHTLHRRRQKTKINKETRINSQSMRMCLPKEGGGWITPKVSPRLLG